MSVKARKPQSKRKRIRKRSRRSEYRNKQGNKLVLGSERFPVFDPLGEQMAVDLVIGKNEQVCIVHEKKLPYVLKWVEFDELHHTINLVSQKGQIQPLGVEIPKEMYEYFLDLDEIAVIRKPADKIQDIYIVSFVFVDDLFRQQREQQA